MLVTVKVTPGIKNVHDLKESLAGFPAEVGVEGGAVTVRVPLTEYSKIKTELALAGYDIASEDELSARDLQEQIKRLLPTVQDENIKKRLIKLEESLSTQDWGKLDVVVGLLWYKLDRLIEEIKRVGDKIRR